MRRVLVVGATTALGQGICAEHQQRGWYVIALVAETAKVMSLAADQLIEADPADPKSLVGVMAGVELVLCCAGINRHGAASDCAEDLSIQNLWREAQRAGVAKFDLVLSQASTEVTYVKRAQTHDMFEGVPHARRPTDQFTNSAVATDAARVYHLNLERKNP